MGGHTQPDLIGGGHDGVTHEVAMDAILGPGRGRARHRAGRNDRNR